MVSNSVYFRRAVYVDTTQGANYSGSSGWSQNAYILGVQSGVDVASPREDRQVRGEKQVSAGYSHAPLISPALSPL